MGPTWDTGRKEGMKGGREGLKERRREGGRERGKEGGREEGRKTISKNSLEIRKLQEADFFFFLKEVSDQCCEVLHLVCERSLSGVMKGGARFQTT
jgi:hypothetical protein